MPFPIIIPARRPSFPRKRESGRPLPSFPRKRESRQMIGNAEISYHVIPAQAGIPNGTEKTRPLPPNRRRIPAYAGMTVGEAGRTVSEVGRTVESCPV